MKRIKLLLSMAMLLSTLSFAESSFQFNVAGNPIPTGGNVRGLRLNLIYGKTSSVNGLDLNVLALGETNNFTGVQIPIFFGLGANIVNNSFTGAGFGIANIHKGNSTGAIFGAVNITHNLNGLQFGAINISDGKSLVDIGFVSLVCSDKLCLIVRRNTIKHTVDTCPVYRRLPIFS